MEQEDKDQRSWPWALALMLMVLIFFSPALNKTFIFRDAFNLFYPYKAVMAEGLRSLDVQLWNPWETLGSSFVGELATAWFYPGNVLYMIFPVDIAFRLYIVGHYLMAALFMWLWLREIKIGPAAAACGALSYTLSGYMLSQNGMPDMLVPCAWLPGTLWILERYLRNRRPAWFILFSTSLAMPFLAGRAESVLLNGAAATGWLVISSRLNGVRQRIWTMVRIMPLAGIVALLISMVQFLPSYELGKLSMKGEGFPLEIATLWSFHPSRLIELILPSPFGKFWPVQNYNAWEITGWEGHYPWSLTHYMGIIILIGLVFNFTSVSLRKKVLLILTLTIVIIFSMGKYASGYELVHSYFPPFRIFRYPEKFMFIMAIIISAFGAFGLRPLFEHINNGFNKRFYIFLLVTGILILLFIGLFQFDVKFAFRPVMPYGVERLSPIYWIGQIDHLLYVILFLIVITLLSRWKNLGRFAGPAILVLIFLDLQLGNGWIVPFAEKEILQKEPAALTVIKKRVHKERSDWSVSGSYSWLGSFRVMREPMEPSEEAISMLKGSYRFERYRRFERHTLKPNFNFIHGIEGLTGYTAAVTADFDMLMKNYLDKETMELFNTRYVISPAQGSWLEQYNLPLAGAKYSYGFKVFYLPDAFPRAFLVGRSLRVEEAMENLDLLETHDFREAVVLEDHPDLPPTDAETDASFTPCEIASYEPEEVKIKISAEDPAYLVLSDSFYPGWKAFINGKETVVFKANFLVRAIWVPEGNHEVVFRYEPVMYRIGRAVSLCAVVICLGIVVFDLSRRKQIPVN